jgi:hypothetical protein
VRPRAVVVMVTVAVAAFVPLGVRGEGETLHVAFEGAPEQASDTAWLNPPCGVTLSVKVVDWPAVTVREPTSVESE